MSGVHPEITLALSYSDRSVPLIERAVTSSAFHHRVVTGPPGALFAQLLQGAQYDICEMSIATYAILLSRGVDDFVAVPAFPSRAFRHSAIYARETRRDDGTDTPIRRIGVAEYQMTAAIWAREVLRDEVGLDPDSVEWITGSVEPGHRAERIPLPSNLPVSVRPIEHENGLATMLRDGELDLIIAPIRPVGLARGWGPIVRYLGDFGRRERAFFERTRVFPIMHTAVVRRSALENMPWLAAEAYDLLSRSKELALERLAKTDALMASVPLLPGVIEEHQELFGSDDIWPYGAEPNRHALETFLEICQRQHLLDRPVTFDELFPLAL